MKRLIIIESEESEGDKSKGSNQEGVYPETAESESRGIFYGRKGSQQGQHFLPSAT